MSLTIDVTGTPAPQGSKRGFVVNGRVVMTESSRKVKPWRQDVKRAALDATTPEAGAAFPTRWEPLAGPIEVSICFYLPRPGYHYGTGKNAHLLKPSAPTHVEKKPDIDKLVRSTLDGLGEAGVWRDDSQVADLHVSKRYATGAPPGARIVIAPIPDAVAAPTSTPDAATAQPQEVLFR